MIWDVDAWQTVATGLLHDLARFVPRLLFALVVLAVAWALANAAQRLVRRATRLRNIDPGLVSFLSESARTLLVVVGVITALGTLGVEVSALVAGLGLVGLTVGFALKDMVSNAMAGIMVLFYRPFRAGDHITVTALAGKVVEVNFRYTVLDATGKWIFVPNANLFTNPVEVRKDDGAPDYVI